MLPQFWAGAVPEASAQTCEREGPGPPFPVMRSAMSRYDETRHRWPSGLDVVRPTSRLPGIEGGERNGIEPANQQPDAKQQFPEELGDNK